MKEQSLSSMISDLDADQAAFLRGLVEGKNQTDAYQEVYGSERRSAESSASRLISNDKFHPVYVMAMLESVAGLLDGFRGLSPIILRRVGEILESENEAVVARVIDSLLDRIGIIKRSQLDVEGGINIVYFDKADKDL